MSTLSNTVAGLAVGALVGVDTDRETVTVRMATLGVKPRAQANGRGWIERGRAAWDRGDPRMAEEPRPPRFKERECAFCHETFRTSEPTKKHCTLACRVKADKARDSPPPRREAEMPHSARWRCTGCGRELGAAQGAKFAVAGPRVTLTPTGTVVTCPDCKAERT